jgi:hypothetical protein
VNLGVKSSGASSCAVASEFEVSTGETSPEASGSERAALLLNGETTSTASAVTMHKRKTVANEVVLSISQFVKSLPF